MLDELKTRWFFVRRNLLFEDGKKKGLILPFEDEVMNRLDNHFFNGIPLSFELKFLRPNSSELGRCYERSLFLTMGVPNATLVRGKQRSLELKFGSDMGGHGWIEKDGWVYDPTSLLKIRKDLYYRLHEPYDIYCIPSSEYSIDSFYQDIYDTKIEDYQPGGSKRHMLLLSIPLMRAIVRHSKNEDAISQFEGYLGSIEYDEKAIYEELASKINDTKKSFE